MSRIIKKSLILICIYFSLLNPGISFGYENSVYIWQRSWDEHVGESISDLKTELNKFIILCGDLRYENGKISINTVDIDWNYFSKGDAEIILAIRINTGTKALLKSDSVYQVIDGLEIILDKAILSTQEQRIKITEVQLDYDCPTSKLADYGKFLALYKERFPSLKISITALPTWLNSKEFKKVVKNISYYVLQLHSFEIPKTMDKAKQIFLKDSASLYVKRAVRLKHPFSISLPTYGYEVVFDKNGGFLGLRGEVKRNILGKDIQYKAVMTDPAKILSFLDDISLSKLDKFLGICWFRMPLETDEFNWHTETFKAVLNGYVPHAKFNVKIEKPQPGLYEIYLVNNGNQNILRPVEFKISWAKGATPLYDILGQFQGKTIKFGDGIEISGFPPKVGNEVFVAWFKYKEEIQRELPMHVSEVLLHETNN